jgi:AraC-like DNA-binding protein
MEETTLALVGELLSAVDQPANDTTLSLRDRELAQHAQAVVASSFSRPIALQDVASRLNTSVYHLCRAFKRATGATLWSEVQRLRTRAALTHLASGATDLTALGLTLGYAHHSHFTAAFRREVGFTPSVARRILTTGSIAQVRELLAH